jgi:hypothetical protein
MDDRVDPAQGVAEREGIAEVAERDLHLYAVWAEAAWIADQAAHRRPGGGQSPQ